MRRIGGHVIGLDEGNETLFSDFETDGEMWTGEGPREIRRRVTFSEPYDSPPSVMVSLSMWDFAHAANVRADISAETIDRAGFDIVFRTWGDTRIARVRVAWRAIGGVSGEDAWDI